MQNPLTANAQLIATPHDKEGRVNVPGFYDDVAALPEDERAAWTILPFSEDEYRDALGVSNPFGERGYSTLERQWARPTLEVNGLYGGYQGAGIKTVLPSEAHAKLTCRLVPYQEPEDVLNKIERHLERHVPAGVTLNIRREKHVARAYSIAGDHPVLRVAEGMLAGLCKRPVLQVGMGGSVPTCDVFKCRLGFDTLFFSFAVADENIYAPNEFFRVPRLKEGFTAWAALFRELGGMV